MSQTNYKAYAAAKEFIETHPEQAQKAIHAQTEIGDRYNVQAKVRDFEFTLDEEKPIGSYDSGPNPLEYILASLGACQTVVYKILAAQKGIELKNVKITLKGIIDIRGFLALGDQVKPGFQKLEYETVLFSDEDPEIMQQLVRDVEAQCPIQDTLAHSVDVQARLKTPVFQ